MLYFYLIVVRHNHKRRDDNAVTVIGRLRDEYAVLSLRAADDNAGFTFDVLQQFWESVFRGAYYFHNENA